MIDLKLSIDGVTDFLTKEEIQLFENEVNHHLQSIIDKTCKGNESLGWVDLPENISDDLLKQISKDAERIAGISDVVVIAGIGGSYLGARALIEALKCYFHENPGKKKNPEILYAGHNLAEEYLYELLNRLNDKEYSVIVISKSGTTTETAIAFRLLKAHLEKKYGKQKAKSRIIAITDAQKGALRKLAEKEGYTTYSIPDDVGGRYSVLTPVGLLPIAAAGFNIKKFVEGARNMRRHLFENKDFLKNPAFLYASIRNILYNKGKVVEIMAHYQPNLFYLAEWWKQLFGESEGKQNKGILPVSVGFTTDLHSLGQYVQQGKRVIFETVLSVEKNKKELKIPKDSEDFDGLNFIAGKTVGFVNSMAEKGTTIAHVEGNVPVMKLSVKQLNEKTLGELFYFFQLSCAISANILDVNPFDQPGVESYKENMFALIGKPGHEARLKELKNRMKS